MNIDVEKLANRLALEGFSNLHPNTKFEELHEQIDENGGYFLKDKYQVQFYNIVNYYKTLIESYPAE